MLDVAIAPLPWRLDNYQVSLNKPSAPLLKYAEWIHGIPSAHRFPPGLACM